MRKKGLIVLVLLLVCLVDGNVNANGEYGKTLQMPWTGCGSGQSPGVYAATVVEPGATQRSKAYFEANFQTFNVPEHWTYLYFRNSSTTDADTTVYLIYFSDGGDYLPAFKLTFTTGTQANSNQSGYEFADAVVAVEYLVSGVAKSPENNYVAQYYTDRHWARKIGIVPIEVTNPAYLEITGN